MTEPGTITDEQRFELRKDLLMGSLQRQFDYGRWVLASLLATHLGAFYVISQSGQKASSLFQSSGHLLIFGVASALFSGGLAWINFSVASRGYWQALIALHRGEEFKPSMSIQVAINGTLFGAPLFAVLSLTCFLLAARVAITKL